MKAVLTTKYASHGDEKAVMPPGLPVCSSKRPLRGAIENKTIVGGDLKNDNENDNAERTRVHTCKQQAFLNATHAREPNQTLPHAHLSPLGRKH